MANLNDIARMGYVLENYDAVEAVLTKDGSPKLSKEFHNADGSNAPLVRFQKQVDGTYYVVEAVPDSSAKQMRVVSAYMKKANGSIDQMPSMPQSGPQQYALSEDGANTSVTDILSLGEEDVKEKYLSQSDEAEPGLVWDEYVSDNVDATVANRVDAAARALGMSVRYVESIRAGQGEANEQINGSSMLLSQNMDAPEMFVVGHGLTHRLQELAPKEYNAFRESLGQEQMGREKYMLKEAGGKQVVWLEKSPLTKRELNSHTAVADYITEHIGEMYTIIESGQSVYLGKDLPGEYTQSGYTSYLRQNQRAALRAKNRAITGLGELIEIATNRRWEQTRHPESKDAKYGMYRYDSTFAFPVKGADGSTIDVRAYDVELLIRNASDGKKYLYDIVNIKENTTAAIDLRQRETRLAAYNAAPRGDVSTDIVHDEGEAVNGNFSLMGGMDGPR